MLRPFHLAIPVHSMKAARQFYGEVLQLQGDQRENICQLLTKYGLATSSQLKVHGF